MDSAMYTKIYGGHRLIEMDQIIKNLELNRRQQERWARDNHELIYGRADNIDLKGDDMGDLTLGDRVENHYHGGEKKRVGLAVLIGALLLGGGGLAALPFILGNEPGNSSTNKHVERVEVLEPVVREPQENQ